MSLVNALNSSTSSWSSPVFPSAGLSCESTKRAIFQSLLAKFLYALSLSFESLLSEPGPTPTIRAILRASGPYFLVVGKRGKEFASVFFFFFFFFSLSAPAPQARMCFLDVGGYAKKKKQKKKTHTPLPPPPPPHKKTRTRCS